MYGGNHTTTLFPMRLRAVLRRLALTTTPAQIEPPHDLVLQRLADGIYYERAGHPDRALACYGTVVGTATDPAVAIEALRHQSEVYRNLTQWELALESANAATMRAVLHRLPEAEMDGLNAEGAVYMAQGKFEVATEVFNEVAVAAKSARATGNALQNLASIVAQYGDFKKAHQLLNDAQSHHQTAGDVRGAVLAQQVRGYSSPVDRLLVSGF